MRASIFNINAVNTQYVSVLQSDERSALSQLCWIGAYIHDTRHRYMWSIISTPCQPGYLRLIGLRKDLRDDDIPFGLMKGVMLLTMTPGER